MKAKATRRTLIMIVLAAILVMANVRFAAADDGGETEVHSDLGPAEEGLTPGVGGYKVFGPDAIAIQSIQSVKGNGLMTLDVLYRTGTTDIFEISGPAVKGSHSSESDLFEDEIWIDGAIKEEGQGWYDSNYLHTSGMFAACYTQMPDRNWLQTFIAHSWHHWHTNGYNDWNPETEDSIYT